MNFLQPWGLLLAGLAIVPVLLHLLRRQVVQRIAFPALRYLRNAEQRTARTLRLRDLLLLLSRVALILLLAVAAARPLAGLGDVEDHAPTDAVLLIDNTASMSAVRDGRTLLDLQLDHVRRALERAGPADRFWVFPAVGSPLAASVDAEAARRALDSLSASEAGTDLVERAELAASAVPVEQGRVREIQLYTDGQASGLRGAPLDLSSWGTVAVSMFGIETPANGFVADVRLEPDGTVVPGDPPSVAVALAGNESPGTADGDADTIDVRILVDGGTVAVSRGTLGSEVLVPLPDLEPGAHAVRAELPPSGLRADDARQIGIVAAESPVVLASRGGDGFLEAALETLAADGRIRRTGGDAVYVLEGAGGDVPAGARALVLVPPAELARLPAFQQRLDALGVPWRLTGRSGSGDLGLEGAADLPGVAHVRVSTSHGLDRLAAPASVDDSVLLRTTDGAAWLVRGRTDERVFLLLASPLHPAATDLPVSAAMVPFVERLLLYWSRPAATATRAVDAGATMSLPSRLEGLRSPAGDAVPAEGGAPWTPLRAGMWTLLLPGDDGVVERHVGVNVPIAESDLRPASQERIRAAFAADVRVASSPEAWDDAIFSARRGAEATPWVVSAILLLALVELLLAAPRQRQPDETAEPA